jgi:hypothetical protein
MFYVDWRWFCIEILTETILYVQMKERFVLDAQGGHVAYVTGIRDRATLNLVVEDTLKERTEGCHDGVM